MALVVFTRVIAEMTNGTTAAAVVCPIVFGVTEKLGLNPVPYWFITTMAFNAEFLLPISVRAIPVSYGLDADKMLKWGNSGCPCAYGTCDCLRLCGDAAVAYLQQPALPFP